MFSETQLDGALDRHHELLVPRTKKKILLINTGGVMGMERHENGIGEMRPGFLREQVQNFPENSSPDMPDCDINEFDPLIESADVGPEEWQKIAEMIDESYLSYDGFVVVMGTDTLAYSACMLSFMLENLAKTVVFTASQLQMSDVYTDARRNLLVSILFAANSNCPEVCVAFDTKILRGNRSVKVHSRGLGAFESPNYPPLSDLASSIMVHRDRILPLPHERFKVHKDLTSEVIVIKLIPGFDDRAIYELIKNSTQLKAIIIELYGTGTASMKKGKAGILDAIIEARSRGIITIALSQCLSGGVDLNRTAMGRDLLQAGVVTGRDMTTEACSTKLAYLFGRYKDPAVVSALVSENLRGELTPWK